MPREILVDWTTPTGSDHRSVFYFHEAPSVTSQRAALQTFLTAVKGSLSSSVAYTIETSGREMDSVTGTLTGAWADGTAFGGLGASVTQPVADATQLLFRWATGTVVNGRFLKGRTFIPGYFSGGLSGGNVVAAQVTALSGVANTFANSATAPVVWHRPTQGAGGLAVQMNGGSLWTELAVLRRRR